VLHRAGEPVLLAGDGGEVAQRLEVDGDVGDGAVGEHHAAVRGPDCTEILERPASVSPALPREARQLAAVAVHVGAELLGRGVLRPHLADLAADGDGDALGLERRM
jgi:hypothetical protein